MQKKVLAFICVCALVLGLIPAVAPINAEAAILNGADGETFKAGFAKICINPRNDTPLPLGGYSDSTERTYELNSEGQLSTSNTKLTKTLYMDDNGDGKIISGVGGTLYAPSTKLDGLFATAIAVQDRNGHIAIFISYDGISANGNITVDTVENKNNGARTRIVKAAKSELSLTIDAASINLNASHSHSGVLMSGGVVKDNGEYDATMDDIYDGADYREDLRNWFKDVAIAALADMKPATISKGSAATEGMNFVRHYHDDDSDKSDLDVAGDNAQLWKDGVLTEHVKECDPNIYMLQFEREGAAPILLANWRAHPKANSTATSVWGTDHRNCTSSDYVNAFRRVLEEEGYCVAFFQGAAGNVNMYSELYGSLNVTSIDSRNPTNGATVFDYDSPYVSGTTTRVVQTGNLYGEELARYAKLGLNNMKAVTSDVLVQAASLSMTEDRDYSKKDIYDVISTVTINDIRQTLINKGYLKSTDAYRSWRSMTVMQFLADYMNYSGAYDPDNDNVSSSIFSNPTNLATALRKYYQINSTYHLGKIYSDRALAENAKGTFAINVVSLGEELAFFFAPFEIFDSNYQADKISGLAASYGTPFVAGYSNTASSYMPDRDAYTYAGTGSYEVNQTSYKQGTAEKIADTMVSALNGLLEQPASTYCEHCKQEADWYIWNPLSTTAVPTGHYFLTQDMVSTLNWQKQLGTEICLNLNGHTYANTSTTTGRAFMVNKNGVLNLMNGTLEGQGYTTTPSNEVDGTYWQGGVIVVASGGEVNMYNTTVRRNVVDGQVTAYGGAVCVFPGGTFNMHSGEIVGGVAQKHTFTYDGKEQTLSGLGGAVYAGGTFNMYGGTISGGTAQIYGNNIHIPSGGTVNLAGGEVYGGGVYVIGSLNMLGTGKITADPENPACNVAVVGSMTMSGNSKVTGGKVTGNGGNINVGGGGKLTVSENAEISGGTANKGNGGNVYIAGSSSALQMNGGVISGGLATLDDTGKSGQGGNIYLYEGAFTMSGGSIIGGESLRPSLGGSVYSLKGAVTLSGGSITGGKAASGNGAGLNINKDNGATLTLTGSASVTGNYNAAGTETNIYCDPTDLTVTGTYTGTAGIYVATIKDGTNIGAAAIGAKITGNLYADGNSEYIAGISGTNVVLEGKAVRDASGNTYYTIGEALATAQSEFTLLRNIADNISINKDVELDLNGKSITGAITYTNGAKITIKDSATDDFNVEDAAGYGTIPESAAVTVAKGYVRIVEDGKASFHRLDLTMKRLSLRPNVVGLYYGSQFGGDQIIKRHIGEYGVSLRANAAPDADYILNDKDKNFRSQYFSADWLVGGATSEKNGVILSGVMKPDNGYTINKRNAEVPVCGVPYVVLDGQMIMGEVANYTLHQFFEIFDSICYSGQASAITMYEAYEQVMSSWNIPNIKADSFAGRTAVFVGDSITYGAKVQSGEQWWNYVKKDLKLGTVKNMGVSGSCISSNNDRAHGYQPLMDRYKNIPGADLIFIFMGTNDFGHNTMIETSDYRETLVIDGKETPAHSDKNRTLAVDLNTVIDYLQQKYPESEIILVTPIVRYTSQKNHIGRTLQEYVDVVKAVGKAQGVAVADIYQTTIAQMPLETYFDADKVHPNAKGHEVLAGIIKDWLVENKASVLN